MCWCINRFVLTDFISEANPRNRRVNQEVISFCCVWTFTSLGLVTDKGYLITLLSQAVGWPLQEPQWRDIHQRAFQRLGQCLMKASMVFTESLSWFLLTLLIINFTYSLSLSVNGLSIFWSLAGYSPWGCKSQTWLSHKPSPPPPYLE